MSLDGLRVPDTQKESARRALEQYGYSEEDFEWVQAQEGLQSGEGLTGGEQPVYVIYKPTGFRRMYDGPNWEAEFTEDLRNQIFKPGS